MIWYIVILFLAVFAGIWLILKSRNLHIWILGYLGQLLRPAPSNLGRKRHVYVCIADHFEPYFNNASQADARELVQSWIDGYRDMIEGHSDSDGRPPQHSYFYPVEEYDEWVLDRLSEICAQGLGDVDIHLHHDNDNADNLAKTLNEFKHLLYRRHGLLRTDDQGSVVYGFIHGNWALDNSRPDGKWCGVDNELDVLVDTGCLYDMTMPSAPSDTQTSIVNRIYFAREDGKPKSHAKGRQAQVGRWLDDRELLMIQGPLTLNWQSRKFGILPRIENGELSADMPPLSHRIKLWRNCGISVRGCENHLFIKLYTHGLQRQNLEMFFAGGGFDNLFTCLESEFKSEDSNLHYVTAWEMYRKIESLCRQDTSRQAPL